MKKNIIKIALMAAGSIMFLSCNKFLDELPDNRTEIDTPDKISDHLVAAYPVVAPYGLMELMSDNVTDLGREIYEGNVPMRDSYRFRKIESTSYDSPHWLWEETYSSIGAANVALEAAMEYEDKELVKAQMGEAYICRAFSHFLLCNLFCQAYNPVSSGSDMGIPYVTEPENTVIVQGDRITVAEVYERIAADIEAGFPLIDDSNYKVPLYHFTKRAAAAFAAQFYLYYGKYDKAIEYADFVLGENPAALYRDWDSVTGTSSDELANTFVSGNEAANIFCHSFTSLYMRYRGNRYVNSKNIRTKETYSSPGPWGQSLNAYNSNTMGFGGRHFVLPKLREYFLLTDPVTGVGEPFIVKVAFSTEKVLLDRAEAYVMLGGEDNFANAARDLCHFYASADTPVSKSADQIAAYYEGIEYYTEADPTPKKRLASRFPVAEGKQMNLLHACLHARRIATLEEGDRLMDLKRYGIAYTHVLDGEDDIHIEPYDMRLAVQIPDMVISAGLPANPR